MKTQCIKLLSTLVLFLWPFVQLTAQVKRPADRIQEAISQQVTFKPVVLQENRQVPLDLQTRIHSQAAQYTVFSQPADTRQNLAGAAATEMQLPMPGGASITLQLVPVNMHTDDYTAVTSSGEKIVSEGIYYQGIVKGNNQSLAAISVFDDEIAGFFSTAEGNYVVGKLRNTGTKEPVHIVYAEKSLSRKSPMNCSTPDLALPVPPVNPVALTTRCVRMYFETEVDFYSAFGNNSASVTNYVNNLFNQVRTLYNNDGVSVALSQIFVWTTTDPYTGSNTSTTLSQFQATRTSFNGDVGQLLTTRGIGGGLAAVIYGLCSSNANRLCVSGNLFTSFPNVPTYSWEVMVTTHEFGHLLGSRHTHACVWNGNNTAIDGCSGFVEGSCGLPGIPAGGGTIMSYCHIQSVGINFNNGFGPQPAAQIRNSVEASACLASCGGGGGTCPAPTGLSAFGDCGFADLFWTAAPGALSYRVEYKRTTATTWLVAATAHPFTDISIFGSAGNYNWRVSSNCNGSTSAFATGTFRIFAPNSPICFARKSGKDKVSTTDGDHLQLKLSPQPAQNIVTLSFDAPASVQAVVTITDQFGAILLRSQLRVQPGMNNLPLQIGSLRSGAYMLKLQMNNEVLSSKLIIGRQ
jgi:hypothetical protein